MLLLLEDNKFYFLWTPSILVTNTSFVLLAQVRCLQGQSPGDFAQVQVLFFDSSFQVQKSQFVVSLSKLSF